MRILVIKQLFHPEPTARSLDFALELKKQGMEVQVLTGFPSYPEGKIYKGFKQKLFQKEIIQGIEIIRVPIIPDQSTRAFMRILNYLSFAFSATFIGLWLVKKHDVAFAYHGALPVGIPAIINKIFRKVPFVYDINDIWPDTLEATGMLKNRLLLRFINFWCQITYSFADHITVLSEGFKKKLIERNVACKKLSVIYHWSRDKCLDGQSIENTIKDKFPSDKFHFLFAGNIGTAQSLYNVIDAFSDLEDEFPIIQFSILGGGSELGRLKKYTRKNGYKNTRFLDRVSSAEVAKYLACANVLLVHLKDDPLFKVTIPSKIIGYHFAGKPILLGLKGDAEELINLSEAGFTFEPDNKEDLKIKVREIVQLSHKNLYDIGRKGRKYYDLNFTLEGNTKKYISIFQNLIKNKQK